MHVSIEIVSPQLIRSELFQLSQPQVENHNLSLCNLSFWKKIHGYNHIRNYPFILCVYLIVVP